MRQNFGECTDPRRGNLGLGQDVNPLLGDDDVRVYYENAVKRGPGAFVETANGFADFETAMRRKLLRELTAQIMGGTVQKARGG